MPHRNQFFGQCRMDRHGLIKIRFRRPHFDRNCNHLDHFAGSWGDNMASQNLLGRLIDNQFHKGFFVLLRKALAHRLELGGVNINWTFGAGPRQRSS